MSSAQHQDPAGKSSNCHNACQDTAEASPCYSALHCICGQSNNAVYDITGAADPKQRNVSDAQLSGLQGEGEEGTSSRSTRTHHLNHANSSIDGLSAHEVGDVWALRRWLETVLGFSDVVTTASCMQGRNLLQGFCVHICSAHGKRIWCRIASLHGQCAVSPMAGQMTTTFRTQSLGRRTSFLGDCGHRPCPLPAAKRGAARHHRPCVVASMTASDSGLTKQQMAILGMASRLPESHAEPSPVWPALPTVAMRDWTTMPGEVMLCLISRHAACCTQELITAKAFYAGDEVVEGSPRVATTMSAGTGAAPGQAPPDLPSLLLDGRICYIGMPVTLRAPVHAMSCMISCM